MQNIKLTALIIGLILITASCGSSGKKERESTVTDKKVELEKLKTEKTKTEEKIKTLEAEIAKIDTGAAKSEKVKLVSVIPVTAQNFQHFINLQGRIDAENISYISPRGMGGQVRQIFVKRGDNVRKGQLLLKLDDAIVRQNIVAAKQGLEQIKTQVSFAKNIYQRQKNLWDQNIGTEVQVISAKNNVDALENQLKTAEENVKSAQEQWATTNVKAEVSGVADQVNIKVGETFQGYAGTMPQIQIVNTSNLKVITDIPENYLTRVRKGSAVKIVVPDLNNKEINTSVSLVSQSININSRGFVAEAKIPYQASLKPNQVAIMKILDYSAKAVIAIPVNTVQTDEQGKYIYVAVKENNNLVARKKHIIVGELSGQLIEVKSGMTSGEQLITEGYQNIYDGQNLKTEIK